VFVAVTLDTLGQRYSLLPSELLTRATTFDLEIADIALSYESYKRNKAQGKTPEIRQDVLQQAIDATRSKA
jgi:hypothetical protein